MIECEMITTMDKIRFLSERYSKRSQWKKCQEELKELLGELKAAGNPFDYEDVVSLPGNTWSEMADVLIMAIQVILQHKKGAQVEQEIQYKLERQFWRMLNEGLITDEEYEKYTGKDVMA